MFEKIGRLAEKAATNVDVSRRGFLGRLARGAALVAGSLGGILLTAGQAGASGGGGWCCLVSMGWGVTCSGKRCTRAELRKGGTNVRCSDFPTLCHW